MPKAPFLLSVAVLWAAPTLAQNVPGDDFHNADNRVIVITAEGVGDLDIISGTSALEAEELQRNLGGTLGDILADQPGVSSTSFSPGTSRPVLRGFQGERVKILTDGLGTIDASNTSADHAVTVDPLTAERIEVLRGPAVLLYGSQAIGGAVNILDKRIPRARPDEDVHFDAIAAYGTNADQVEAGASVDVPLGSLVAFHLDGSYRTSDDLEVPGFTVAPVLRADLLADARAEEEEGEVEEAEDLRAAAEQKDRLPNSAVETYAFGAGAAIFAGNSSLGFSLGYYDTDYGVPGRPGTGHHHGDEDGGEGALGDGDDVGEEQVSIGLKQVRADMRAKLALGGFIETASLRIGYSDYAHTEFEGDEVGTRFDVEGFEGRLVLTQGERGAWSGSLGAQASYRDFEAIGEEAFVAPNVTEQYALFLLQEFDLSGALSLELGGRYERSDVESNAIGIRRTFDNLSGAASLVYAFDSGLRVGATASRSSRAPSAEELFADGPHIATQQFEIGDIDLQGESSIGGEVFVRGEVGGVELSAAAFGNWFDDYIFLQATGDEQDDLPVFQHLQDDARYLGVEGQAVVSLFDDGGLRILTDLRASYVNAELDDGTPLPRIPPLNLFAAVEAETDSFGGRVELSYAGEQTNIAPFETETDDFLFVDASLTWRPLATEDVSLIAQVRNIFDEEGRRHASFTKDFVPLPGRDFRLSARMSF